MNGLPRKKKQFGHPSDLFGVFLMTAQKDILSSIKVKVLILWPLAAVGIGLTSDWPVLETTPFISGNSTTGFIYPIINYI